MQLILTFTYFPLKIPRSTQLLIFNVYINIAHPQLHTVGDTGASNRPKKFTIKLGTHKNKNST